MNPGLLGNPVLAPCPEPGAAKVWVLFAFDAVVGARVLAGYNVMDVARISTGLYRVDFIRPFNTGKFAYVISGKQNSATNLAMYVSSTDPGAPGSKIIQFTNGTVGTPLDPSEVSFTAWGSQ